MDNLLKAKMNRKVVVISPKESVSKAASVMASRDIGCIVSVETGKPVGILTERDILKKVTARGIDPKSLRVRDVMTRKIISLDSRKTIEEAVDLLEQKKIKRLPIIEKGSLIGIVTLTDLVRCLRNIEIDDLKKLRRTIKELHLTKIRLQSRIISLEEKAMKSV
jgi:CBS domain-containing protein